MASPNTTVTVNFEKWPEMIHAMRAELVGALRQEAADAPPDVAEALNRIALRFDIGLSQLADTGLAP